MFRNFEEFINESSVSDLHFDTDFSKSPFKAIEELTHKKGKDKGELTVTGKITHFVFKNPGLTRKEIIQILLDMPGKSEEEMYHKGGQLIGNSLMNAFKTDYVIRDNSKPMKWYARLDKNETLEEIIRNSKKVDTTGVFRRRKFGL